MSLYFMLVLVFFLKVAVLIFVIGLLTSVFPVFGETMMKVVNWIYETGKSLPAKIKKRLEDGEDS